MHYAYSVQIHCLETTVKHNMRPLTRADVGERHCVFCVLHCDEAMFSQVLGSKIKYNMHIKKM